MNMSKRNMILLIAGGFVALILVCVLVVGLVDGIWPWDGITAYTRLLDPTPEPTTEPVTEPTDPEEETIDEVVGGENTENTDGDETGETTDPTGNTLPDEEDIQVGNQVIVTPTTPTEGGSTGSETTEPSHPKDDFEGSASQIPGWIS